MGRRPHTRIGGAGAMSAARRTTGRCGSGGLDKGRNGDVIDVKNLVEEADAADRLYSLFKQGLMDGAALPEVRTEAEEAAHYLLGCSSFNALAFMYTAVCFLRNDDEIINMSSKDIDTLELIGDAYLREQVDAVVAFRGAVGAVTCHRWARYE
jgi:hypothetical protein